METGSTKLTLKWWESTDNRWILFPMGQWCGALMCLCYKAEQAVVPTVGLTVIWDARSRACNVVCLIFMPNYPPNITHIMAGSHQLQSLKLTETWIYIYIYNLNSQKITPLYCPHMWVMCPGEGVLPPIRSSDNDSTGFWSPDSLHTLGADGHI